MKLVIGGLAGLFVGFIVGNQTRPRKPCDFCGYRDDETKELYETEELDRLLREAE